MPPSNFNPDGSMIMASGKSLLVQQILKLPSANSRSSSSASTSSILIIDAMCIVNMVTGNNITTGQQFAEQFVSRIAEMAYPYDEVRIVFDQYVDGSLKQHTRDRRTGKTTPVHYIVNNSTEIKNMKVFMAHIKTKAELTSYLSEKVLHAYREKKKKVVVMHHTQVEANCPLVFQV